MPPMAPAPKMQNFGDPSSDAVFIRTPLEALAMTASIVARVRVRSLLLRYLCQTNRSAVYAHMFLFDLPLVFVGRRNSSFRNLQIANTRFSETGQNRVPIEAAKAMLGSRDSHF
jgi:hypothetical protein